MVYQEIIRSTEMPCSVVGHGVQRNTLERLFNIYSPENIYHSIVPQFLHEESVTAGTFGFTRLMDLSPVEVSFLAKCSLLERLMFSVIRWAKQFIDETVDLFMDLDGGGVQNNQLEESKVRAVARMLLIPTKSEASILRRKLATGSNDAPFEQLVMSHNERFISNISILRSSYAFIPKTRAPPVSLILFSFLVHSQNYLL